MNKNHSWISDVFIGKSSDFDQKNFTNLQNLKDYVTNITWCAISNSGSTVDITLVDPKNRIMKSIIEGNSGGFSINYNGSYLSSGRQHGDPNNLLIVKYRVGWDRDNMTPWRHAVVSNLCAFGGTGNLSNFSFTALDPISYYLNRGNASGKIYKGKIGGSSGVISQVLNQYVPNSIGPFSVIKKIGDTVDSPYCHPMMRMCPKDFIMYLLEWTSSLSQSKVEWNVSSGEDSINGTSSFYIDISDNFVRSFKYPSNEKLVLKYGSESSKFSDILKWESSSDNFLSAVNTKLISSSISMTTGKVVSSRIGDVETPNKFNVKLFSDQSFKKPFGTSLDNGYTFINPVPEYSGAEIGLKYSQYIDGKSRDLYIDTSRNLMRARFETFGLQSLYDVSDLGKTIIRISWVGDDDFKGRYIDGPWILYGWKHVLKHNSTWKTEVMVSRLDYDAISKPDKDI